MSRQKLTSKLLDNLESEINILKAISHRNIVSLTDCFVSPPSRDEAGRCFTTASRNPPLPIEFALILPPLQKNDTHIYLVMEFCSGADLSIYLRNRGRIETLDFVPRIYESGMVASRTEGKVFWPHPQAGGLDERVTRCFLGQLGALLQRGLETEPH